MKAIYGDIYPEQVEKLERIDTAFILKLHTFVASEFM